MAGVHRERPKRYIPARLKDGQKHMVTKAKVNPDPRAMETAKAIAKKIPGTKVTVDRKNLDAWGHPAVMIVNEKA